MLDGKKIEYAATAASISDTEKGRVREGYVINALGDHESGFREGYIESAYWAINEFLKDLWHSTGEKPKKGCVFLYKTIFNGYGLNQIIDGNEWEYIIKYQKATQWLYIDDLFPKEGGENEKE